MMTTRLSVSFHKVPRQSKRVQLPRALAQKTRKTNSSCTTQLEKCSAASRTSVTSFKRSCRSSESSFKLSRKLSEQHQTAFHWKLLFTPAKPLPDPIQQKTKEASAEVEQDVKSLPDQIKSTVVTD